MSRVHLLASRGNFFLRRKILSHHTDEIHVICRGRRNTYHHTSLLKIDGVNDAKASEYYHGKKVAYVYKAKTPVAGSKFRVVWGKIMRAHGSNGVVRAKFATNLNVSHLLTTILSPYLSVCYPQPEWIGNSVRVMLYPSRV